MNQNFEIERRETRVYLCKKTELKIMTDRMTRLIMMFNLKSMFKIKMPRNLGIIQNNQTCETNRSIILHQLVDAVSVQANSLFHPSVLEDIIKRKKNHG